MKEQNEHNGVHFDAVIEKVWKSLEKDSTKIGMDHPKESRLALNFGDSRIKRL